MNKKLIRLTEGDLHRIVKESVNRIMKEVALKGKSGKTYSLHGTDPESWAVMSRVRGKNGYFPNTPQHYHACRDEDNWIELDDKAHPNLRSRNNANRINAMMNRIDDKSKDIMAANESKLSRIVKESVNRIMEEYYPINSNNFAKDNRFAANGFANNSANMPSPEYDDIAPYSKNIGDYYAAPYRDSDQMYRDNVEFNRRERNKQAAADRRWMKAVDSRPLYKKNSPNNDIPR